MLLSILAAGEETSDDACRKYIKTQLYIACGGRYNNSNVLSRRKRYFPQKYVKFIECCFNPCNKAKFRSHCADYTYYDVNEEIAEITNVQAAVSTPMVRNSVNSILCNFLNVALN